VEASKTLRCGYVIWEPYITKDLATGAMSGISYDYINSIAAREGLKVEWSEVAIDQIVPSVATGKMDMFCLPCSPVKEWEERLAFIGDFGHLPYFTYVAAKSEWTPETLATGRFTVVDSYIPMVETPKAWPRAHITSLPQSTSMGELYDQIRYGKADALVNEQLSASNYMKSNPDVIKKFSEVPVVLKPMTFVAAKDDNEWRDWFVPRFATAVPANHSLLQDLMQKYNVSADMLMLDGK
jgi:ABC-type amino acid transport substrate-binding protein